MGLWELTVWRSYQGSSLAFVTKKSWNRQLTSLGMGSTQISLENLLQVKAGRWAIAGGGCWAGGWCF